MADQASFTVREFVGKCRASASCVLADGHEGACEEGELGEVEYEVEAILAEKGELPPPQPPTPPPLATATAAASAPTATVATTAAPAPPPHRRRRRRQVASSS